VSRIVLFGATGYTGRLTAEALVARGAKPLLAGRDGQRLEALARELGDLETQTADISRPETVAALIGKGDVMLTTVGPFMRWGAPAAEAAIEAGAVYIDSTGESPFIREIFESYGPRAKQTGAALLTALGYDWVPGNLAGATALERAGGSASRVEIGYFFSGVGRDGSSGGTRASLVGALLAPSFAWENGRLVTVRGGRKARAFPFPGRNRMAVSVGSSEHFGLPRLYPGLRDVETYLGWFGPMSRPMQAMSAITAGAQKLPGVTKGLNGLANRFIKGSTGGPDAETRAKGGSQIVAIAYDDSGKTLAEVRIDGVEGYTFTGAMLAWAATTALGEGVSAAGALGPVEAFGLDRLTSGVAEAGLTISG